MKVVLKENVKSLGNIGEIVNVSPGFARNYLMPRDLAIIADKSHQKALADYQKALSKKIDAEKKVALELQKKVQAIQMTLIKKVGANSKLFGSVTTQELADELAKKEIHVDRRQISVDRPVKQLGQYEVKVKLFTDVVASFVLKIEIDAAQAEELKKMQKDAAERKKKEKKEAELAEKKAQEDAAKLAEDSSQE